MPLTLTSLRVLDKLLIRNCYPIKSLIPIKKRADCEYDIRRIPDVIQDLIMGQAKDQDLLNEEECIKEPGINATVLLECVANLVGNELFDNPDRPWSADPMKVNKEEFVRMIMDDIWYLADHVTNLIIVSSEYELE